MNIEDVIQEFKDADAILQGHFILSSGLHSDTYLQCARAMMDPKRAERLCNALASKIKKAISKPVDLVVSPAMGGVVVGYEMGRQLGVNAIFCERENGTFTFRRGFAFEKNTNILVVEDVVTTGKSSLEAIKCIEEHGGNVIAEASLINRSGKENPLSPLPLISLANVEVQTFPADQVPETLADIPAIKPGSRWLT